MVKSHQTCRQGAGKGGTEMETTNVFHRERTRGMTECALCAALIALCAWIAVPGAVPFTMQTFGVFAALSVLGGKRGTAAVAVYLGLGLLGLPVFSGFRGGPGALLGATGGYIMGFLALALTVWGLERLLGRSLWAQAAAMTLGLLVCYAFGTAWFLAVYTRTTGPIGLGAALGKCVLPFVPLDLGKMFLALLVGRRVRRAMEGRQS